MISVSTALSLEITIRIIGQFFDTAHVACMVNDEDMNGNGTILRSQSLIGTKSSS